MAKDLFSNQSNSYAKYRPDYPNELFDYIIQFVENKKLAWDCATGNGQAAKVLADYFEKVEASDISEAQLKNAVQKQNIKYHLCSAEQTPFDNDSFDLITVAQAYHWLNWKKFHDEATRVGKKNAVVAIWTYTLITADDDKINSAIKWFYKEITGPYWDYERKFVDDGYATVDFDFDLLPSKTFEIKFNWNKEQMIGFFETWSAVQKYIKRYNTSPIPLIEEKLNEVWDDEDFKTVRFHLFLKLGRIVK